MKELIIIAIIAFFATAWVMDFHTPPQPVKVGVKDVGLGSISGCRKKDEMYGDFKMINGYRPIKYRYTIYDDKDKRVKRNDADFPMSGGAVN